MLKAVANGLARVLPGLMMELCGFVAVSAIIYGTWQINQPAAFIVGGILVLAGVFFASLDKKPGG